jgi:hypothetical protein
MQLPVTLIKILGGGGGVFRGRVVDIQFAVRVNFNKLKVRSYIRTKCKLMLPQI